MPAVESDEATFYVWTKKYANLGVSELRQLRQLRDENARLKRLLRYFVGAKSTTQLEGVVPC